MDNPKKASSFTVNKEKCVGCALCVAACPMKILEIIDNLCVLTNENKCLECGSCRDKCPERAIIVASKEAETKTTVIETDKDHLKIVRNPETNFTPVAKPLLDIICSALRPVQIFDYKGTDMREINTFT